MPKNGKKVTKMSQKWQKSHKSFGNVAKKWQKVTKKWQKVTKMAKKWQKSLKNGKKVTKKSLNWQKKWQKRDKKSRKRQKMPKKWQKMAKALKSLEAPYDPILFRTTSLHGVTMETRRTRLKSGSHVPGLDAQASADCCIKDISLKLCIVKVLSWRLTSSGFTWWASQRSPFSPKGEKKKGGSSVLLNGLARERTA